MYLNWVLRGKISSVVFQVDIFGSSNLDRSFSMTFVWSSVFSPLIVYRSSRTIGRFLRQPNGTSFAIFPTTFFLVSYDLKLSFLRPQKMKFTDFPILSVDFWREDAERMSEGAADGTGLRWRTLKYAWLGTLY